MSKVKHYDESHVPQDCYVHVNYLHEGNSSANERKKIGKTSTNYVTVARVVSKSLGYVVSQATAACGHRDNPSRTIGRQVAVGRALKKYYGNREAIQE